MKWWPKSMYLTSMCSNIRFIQVTCDAHHKNQFMVFIFSRYFLFFSLKNFLSSFMPNNKIFYINNPTRIGSDLSKQLLVCVTIWGKFLWNFFFFSFFFVHCMRNWTQTLYYYIHIDVATMNLNSVSTSKYCSASTTKKNKIIM